MTTTLFAMLAAIQTTPAAPPAPAGPPAATPAPDYAQDAAWLCRPGRQDACTQSQDVTVIRADGGRKTEKFRAEKAPAFDCFYVYPTVSRDPTPNSDLTAGPEEQAVAAAQAARFTSKCRIYAPLYRQKTLASLRQEMAGGTPPVDQGLPLHDVYEAWNSYLQRDNKGRGIVLIGHSQGSLVLKELIARYIEGQPSQRNIVAAYLLGVGLAVPQGGVVGGDLKRLPLCTKPGRYACVVSYASFRADSPPPANSRFGKVTQPGMAAACVNPAALAGGKAVMDAIFATKGAGLASAEQASWSSTGGPVTTPFVKVPGLISAECTSASGFSYLAVTVNANPADPRTDTIVGDVVADGAVLKEWGLHLLDMSVAMGDLVQLADAQAQAWRGVGLPAK